MTKKRHVDLARSIFRYPVLLTFDVDRDPRSAERSVETVSIFQFGSKENGARGFHVPSSRDIQTART